MQKPNFASQISEAYSAHVNPYGVRRLSSTFRPGSYDVLCARGKLAYDAEGNHRFRDLVKQHQTSYSACTCKYQKSKIVSHIVNTVRKASPQGGFIKQIDGCWYEVGDRHAKEKAGQTFRDLLHTKYSSSTKAKARARVQRRVKSPKSKQNTIDAMDEDSKQVSPVADRILSKSRVVVDELRSSISVVSDGSDDESQKPEKGEAPQLPPLKDIRVYKSHPGNPANVQRRRSQHRIGQERTSDNSLMLATLRSSIETFDGGHWQSQARANGRHLASLGAHHHDHNPVMFVDVPVPAGLSLVDLEPLPLREHNVGGAKVAFNDSHGAMETEQSFEDAMSDYAHEMGVPV